MGVGVPEPAVISSVPLTPERSGARRGTVSHRRRCACAIGVTRRPSIDRRGASRWSCRQSTHRSTSPSSPRTSRGIRQRGEPSWERVGEQAGKTRRWRSRRISEGVVSWVCRAGSSARTRAVDQAAGDHGARVDSAEPEGGEVDAAGHEGMALLGRVTLRRPRPHATAPVGGVRRNGPHYWRSLSASCGAWFACERTDAPA